MSFKSIFVLVPETKNLLQCASRLIPTSATIEIWDEIAAKGEKNLELEVFYLQMAIEVRRFGRLLKEYRCFLLIYLVQMLCL